ncbi:MAG: TonB-dependent receptor, partial [Sphingobacteriales bacterium]
HQLPDSALITTEVADSNGHFSIALPNGKSGYIVISSTGYISRNVSLQDKREEYIVLKPDANLLQDVTIQTSRKLVERRADRTIFNVESSITAVGSDAFDMLKKAPGVQVNNGNVSIAGKSAVSIMINDRLVQVTGTELEAMLRSMSAGDISKIEVVTAPPAKYDAEGNSGIINIVTKKSQKNGLNGNLTLSSEWRTKASQKIQGAFNYRNGRLNVYGNSNVNRLTFVSEQYTNTAYPDAKQNQMLDQNNRPLFTWSQLGADYNIGKQSVLGLLYTHGSMDTERDEWITTRFFSGTKMAIDSAISTKAFATDLGRRNVINLNYDWKIDSSGRKLSLNADYFTRGGRNSRDFTIRAVDPNGPKYGIQSDNRTYGDQGTDIISNRADLEWPLAWAKLSAGAKASWIHNYSNNVFNYLSGNDYVNDTGRTNTFDYRENTQALYVNASREWGKWNAQLGFRAEYTQTRGTSITLSQVNTNRYFKIFPTAYLQYRANDNHSWNINYSRRINRPSFWDMNPFRRYTTATAYEDGNPFLQPSFSNNIELGYAYKSVLAFTFFVQNVKGYATRVSFIDTDNSTFHFSQANAGNELQYGLSATLSFSPLPWWETTTALYASYNKFSSDFYAAGVSYSRPSLSMEMNNTFMLNRSQTLVAELGFEFSSREQSDFDEEYARASLNLGLKALFFRKRFTLALSGSDLLRTDIWQVSNQYNGTFQRSYFDNRMLRVSLGWKFGNQLLKEKRERNSNSDESNRAN